MSKYPHPHNHLKSKADSLSELGRFAEAESIYRELTARYPKKRAGFLGLLRSAARQEQHDVVLEHCKQFIPLFPAAFSFVRLQLNALTALARFEEAEQLCQNILRKHEHQAKEFAYLTLARISAAQATYGLAVDYANKAIALCPSSIDGRFVKGSVLCDLWRLEEAQALFEKMLTDFPDHVKGHIGLHKVYRRMENHSAALSAIRKAYEVEPTNQVVVERYATALEINGQVEQAYRLLEHHIHQLNHEFCVPALVKLYSKYGRTSKVLEMMECRRELLIRHPDLQITLGLALRNRGNLPAAYAVFKQYLDLDTSPTVGNLKQRFGVYKQLKLLYSVQRNAHLFKHYLFRGQHLPKPYLHKDKTYQRIIDLLEEGDSGASETLLSELLDEGTSDNTARFTGLLVHYSKQLEQVARHFEESYLDIGESPSSAANIAEKIIHRIQHKTPTSMIRLGDGEGNFLEYASEYKDWQDGDRIASQRVWWGDAKLTEADMDDITGRFCDAVSNADILGVPDLARRVRGTTNFDYVAGNIHARGLMAIFNHLGSQCYLNAKLPTSILTSCHYHTDLEFWGVYRYILSGVERVTLITCHEEIARVVADRFGIGVVDVILIPSEYRHCHQLKTHQADNDHYPHRFNQILSEISVSKGDLFLVAAGYLGKIYCNEIKKKGGIGIDIGSVADMWLGYTTRVEHEYSRPAGVNLDLDLLRKETFPDLSP